MQSFLSTPLNSRGSNGVVITLRRERKKFWCFTQSNTLRYPLFPHFNS